MSYIVDEDTELLDLIEAGLQKIYPDFSWELGCFGLHGINTETGEALIIENGSCFTGETTIIQALKDLFLIVDDLYYRTVNVLNDVTVYNEDGTSKIIPAGSRISGIMFLDESTNGDKPLKMNDRDFKVNKLTYLVPSMYSVNKTDLENILKEQCYQFETSVNSLTFSKIIIAAVGFEGMVKLLETKDSDIQNAAIFAVKNILGD